MGLTNALQTGKTSLLSAQTAIEVTGTNIANVNTKGYSRQSAEFTDYPALLLDGFFVGQGVDVGSISRGQDAFRETQLNSKSIDLGYREARSNPLSAMEQAVSISDSSLSSKIDEFFASWQSLAANPGGSVERENVLQKGAQVADAFHSAVTELESIATSTDQQLEAGMQGLNDKLAQLADLNVSIAKAAADGYSPNADLDKRDLLVRELGRELGAIPVDSGEEGMINLMLPPEDGGTTLVSGGTAGEIALDLPDDGPAVVTVTLGANETTLAGTDFGGEFAGNLEIRDTDVPKNIAELDKLAFNLATAVNAAHGNGSPGGDFFEIDPAVTTGSARAIKVAISNIAGVSAGTTSASGDNRNALAMAELGSTPQSGLEGATFVGFYGSLASSIGTASSQNELALDGAQDSMVQLENMRDAKVGVSLEEEMISLMQFQKGFEASARFISTVDEMMDTIIGMKR